MSIIKKIATGALVNWSASKGGYKSQSGSFVMPDSEYKLDIALERDSTNWIVFGPGNLGYPLDEKVGTSASQNIIEFTNGYDVRVHGGRYESNYYTSFNDDKNKTIESIPGGEIISPISKTMYMGLEPSRIVLANYLERQITHIDYLDARHISQLRYFITVRPIGLSGLIWQGKFLEYIHGIQTSDKLTSMIDAFSGCVELKDVSGNVNTSNVTEFSRAFYNCSALKSINFPLDMTSSTNNANIFYQCYALEDVTFIGSLNVGCTLSYCPNLTYDSILSILTAAANTENLDSKRLLFDRTIEDHDGELDALVASCVSKNWTITGLTLV